MQGVNFDEHKSDTDRRKGAQRAKTGIHDAVSSCDGCGQFVPPRYCHMALSRRILFVFDDVKILHNYMFSYLSCQVNELYIIVEVM